MFFSRINTQPFLKDIWMDLLQVDHLSSDSNRHEVFHLKETSNPVSLFSEFKMFLLDAEIK